MTQLQFIIGMTVVLFLAFGLGWFTSWLIQRFTRVSQADIGELDRMARMLHDAEETRDQALDYIEQRERSLTTQLSQTKAELRAAMEGLRDARAEAHELRNYIEAANSRG